MQGPDVIGFLKFAILPLANAVEFTPPEEDENDFQHWFTLACLAAATVIATKNFDSHSFFTEAIYIYSVGSP